MAFNSLNSASGLTRKFGGPDVFSIIGSTGINYLYDASNNLIRLIGTTGTSGNIKTTMEILF